MGSELGLTSSSTARVNFDTVGVFYLFFTVGWTLFVGSGMTFLALNRHTRTVRMRGLGFPCIAITLLHIYLTLVHLYYSIGPVLPGQFSYWIMGTFLPFGLAFFHATNTRFLHVAKAQQRFAVRDSMLRNCRRAQSGKRSLIEKYRQSCFHTKVMVGVLCVMAVQLFFTILMFLISRRFHPSYGIPGTEIHGSPMHQRIEMGRGWEWWPTIAGQLFWSWMVTPYVLWKARNIRDTHGWRLQTIVCCLASLHATPMWLIGIYVPAMENIDIYFLPSEWIVLSIIIIEISTVFVPCWQIVTGRNLERKTINCIAQLEKQKTKPGFSDEFIDWASANIEFASTDVSIKARPGDQILTMNALEYVLSIDSEPLQQFAALRDFSGENIAFLVSLADWRATMRKYTGTPASKLRESFNGALRIYIEFVSRRDADFPVNLYFREIRRLEAMFEGPTRAVLGEKQEYDSTEMFSATKSTYVTEDSEIRVLTARSDESNVASDIQFLGDVPDEFNEKVFDDAEKSIKYLVLTNTWPRYIKDIQESA